MSGVTGPMSVDRVMALRAQIVERNQALSRAQQATSAAPAAQAEGPASFTDVFEGAVRNVNNAQARAGELSAAYERGETVDIAKVMLARQEASVGFEATMQVRNKLLSAYKDIMSMPV
ncbi:flagellar hook-basal body complex protein FliE [Sphingosinithalassobacter portus]|uniref:flagellar hook-basal body complex protein FliE n=1 Tax=Stakelama portus TaxID=2676234 RepID=UPI000D6E4C7F|nr:flagellar hook-basal body complex protein FliE [Sphingosinithalassobacter portus]